MFIRMWGSQNTYTLLVGCKIVWELQITVLVPPQKVKHDPSIPLLVVYTQGIKNRHSHKNSHTNVHYSQYPKDDNNPSSYQQMKGYTESDLSVQWNLSHKKEQSTDICYTRMNLEDIMLSGKTAILQKSHMGRSMYLKCPDKANPQSQEAQWWLLGLGGGEDGEWLLPGQVSFWCAENLELDIMIA